MQLNESNLYQPPEDLIMGLPAPDLVSAVEKSNDLSQLDVPIVQAPTQDDSPPGPVLLEGWRKYLSIFAAGLCLTLGAIGAVLPGIPTTPFLLLASYLLIRSSPRLHQKLRNNRLFGPLLRNWETHRAVSRSVKIWSLVVVVFFLSLSLYLSIIPWYLQAVIVVAGAIGIYVICRLPVIRAE